MDAEPELEPVSLALTRPPMMLGVRYEYFALKRHGHGRRLHRDLAALDLRARHPDPPRRRVPLRPRSLHLPRAGGAPLQAPGGVANAAFCAPRATGRKRWVARALRRDLALGAVAARDLDQSLHIPYLRHVEDRVILTKQGFLVAFIALGGLCFQTLDQADLNLRYVNRNVNLRALGSSRFAVYGHVIRRTVQPTLDGEFENPFLAEIDARYQASLEAKRLFVNEIVLSVIRRPMQGRIGLVESAFDLFRREAAGEEPRAQALSELIEVATALKRDLSAYNARILSVVRRAKAASSRSPSSSSPSF